MRFETVEIHNYKGISDMKLAFRPGVNLILGENGVGKTSVLEAMTVALSSFFNGISGVTKKGIVSSDIRFNTHPGGDASTKVEYYTPTVVRSTMYLTEEVGYGEVRKDESKQSRTKYIGNGLSTYANRLCNDMDSDLPLICYFSTQRMAQPKREDFGSSRKNELNDRRCGYIGCIDDNLDRKSLEAWCLKMEMSVFKQNNQIREYETFKKIVSTFMQYMNDLDHLPTVEYSRVFDEMVYEENGTSTPIKYLSAGYQSLLWMVMTMAFRLCQLNPDAEDYQQISGIVLIDEIDMHLHPRWQWKIVDALQNTFPSVQFVLATHAPIIISSCKDANLIQIDDDQSVEYLPPAYAQAIDDIAELTQGSSGIPIALKNLRKEFDKAFRGGDKLTAEVVYQEMEDRFGYDNTEVDLAKRRLSIM